MENSIGKVPIHLKMTLTAKEAAEYSNIGIKKSTVCCVLQTVRLCFL